MSILAKDLGNYMERLALDVQYAELFPIIHSAMKYPNQRGNDLIGKGSLKKSFFGPKWRSYVMMLSVCQSQHGRTTLRILLNFCTMAENKIVRKLTKPSALLLNSHIFNFCLLEFTLFI